MGYNPDGSWDGKGVPPLGGAAQPKPDQTGQIALGYDGQWHYITWDANGQEHLSVAVAPPPASTQGSKALTYDEQMALAQAPRQSNSSSVSSSTSQNVTPQVYQAQDGSTHVFDPRSGQDKIIAPAGVMTPYQAAQLQNAYDIAQMQNKQSGANTQTTEAGANARNAATIAGSAANTAAGNAFGAWQQGNQQGFTANQNALSAAQQAGQFAATYSIQKANQETQDRLAQVQAAKTFSDLSAAPDLTGYDRFLAAGGGNAGNAIMRGGTSLTATGQLGAGRALQAARAPLPTYADAPAVPTVAPWQATPWNGAPQTQTAAQPGAAAGGGQSWSSLWAGQGGNAPATIAGVDASNASTGGPQYSAGYAFGTGQRPIVREPVAAGPMGNTIDNVTARYALGTMRPAGANVVGYQKPPMPQDDPNAGIPDGFAHGTFIAGDSTAQDPAAGGAHPEMVSLQDPPGPNNARATVDPMVPPGVGDTEDEGDDGDPTEMLGALLVALGNFLNAAHESTESKSTEAGEQRLALGAMGKRRFALGSADPTTIDPSANPTGNDQAAVDEVLGMRRGTQYNQPNPFSADYQFQDPTQKAIDAAGFQTATGAPSSELGYIGNRYQPGGLGRGSMFNRELQIGV